MTGYPYTNYYINIIIVLSTLYSKSVVFLNRCYLHVLSHILTCLPSLIFLVISQSLSCLVSLLSLVFSVLLSLTCRPPIAPLVSFLQGQDIAKINLFCLSSAVPLSSNTVADLKSPL